jgi:hypothetical protein
MNRHKHAELMAQYAQDAMTTFTPWVFWQCRVPRSIDPRWEDCRRNPLWVTECDYRRKPKQHTIVLTTEQLREVIMACEFPSWENEDFTTAEQILINALNGEQV